MVRLIGKLNAESKLHNGLFQTTAIIDEQAQRVNLSLVMSMKACNIYVFVCVYTSRSKIIINAHAQSDGKTS